QTINSVVTLPTRHATSTACTSTLSLHDALPISRDAPAGADGLPGRPRFQRHRGRGVRAAPGLRCGADGRADARTRRPGCDAADLDRKSTRLNSSHGSISYAVFCLKKKTTQLIRT